MAVTAGQGYIKMDTSSDIWIGYVKVKAILFVNLGAVAATQRLDGDGNTGGLKIIARYSVAANQTQQISFKGDGVWLRDPIYQEVDAGNGAYLLLLLA